MQTLKNENGITSPFYILSIFLLLTVALNGDLGGSRIVWWSTVAVFVVLAFITQAKSLRINTTYTIWLLLFSFVSFLSLAWALSTTLVMTVLKSTVVYILLFSLLAASIKSRRDIDVLLSLILAASVVNALYLLIKNPDLITSASDEIGGRLGTDENWNANLVGMMCAFGTVIVLYFMLKQKKKKPLPSILFLVLFVFLAFASFVTGSRKAFLAVIVGLFIYLLLRFKHRRFRILIFLAGITVITFLLIYNVPVLYNIIGWRVEGLIASLTGKGEVDHSTIVRQQLTDIAVEAWKDRPLLGWGTDCVRIFSEAELGKSLYAHNNYLELLADLGILGFTCFYWGYAYCIFKTWQHRADDTAKLMLALIVLMLVLAIGCVHYNDFLFGVQTMLFFSYIKIAKESSSNVTTQNLSE